MGKVFSSIFKTISSVVSGIIKTISSVVKAVFNTISSVIRGILNFFFNSQIGILLGVAFLFLPSNALWSIGKFLFHIERYLPLPVTTRLGLQLKTLSLFGKLQGYMSSIWFKVEGVTSSLYKIYKLQEIKLKFQLWDLNERFAEALGFNVGQLVGKIYERLKWAGERLEKLVILSQIYNYFEQKEYFKGIYALADWLDIYVSETNKHVLTYFKSIVDAIYREIWRYQNIINTILRDVDTKVWLFERAFRKLGQNFGIEALEDVADFLGQEVRGAIEDVRGEAYQFFSELRRLLYRPNTLVYNINKIIYEWDQFKKQEQAIIKLWSYNPFLHDYRKVPLMLYIPTPIRLGLSYER
jgi:hypothetical protein